MHANYSTNRQDYKKKDDVKHRPYCHLDLTVSQMEKC